MWERRNEIDFPTNLEYMMQHIDRFAEEHFVPTNTDVLYARQRTTGVVETHFSVRLFSASTIASTSASLPRSTSPPLSSPPVTSSPPYSFFLSFFISLTSFVYLVCQVSVVFDRRWRPAQRAAQVDPFLRRVRSSTPLSIFIIVLLPLMFHSPPYSTPMKVLTPSFYH
jgi:hypothetical protein